MWYRPSRPYSQAEDQANPLSRTPLSCNHRLSSTVYDKAKLRMSPKTVLITGCSDGSIGSGLAKTFAAHGLKVIATARSVSKMSTLATVSNMTLLELDIRSSNNITAALKTVSVMTGGTLDYLVNNAGVAYRCAALEADDRVARDLFDVNFWGVVDMCRTFAPLVIKAKGTIVNVSSLNGIGVPLPWSCESHLMRPSHQDC